MKKSGVDRSIVQTAARESLARIARTLDEPIDRFFSPDPSSSRDAETLAILRAFDRIKDPQARARCLTFVTAEAERS